MLTGFRSKKEIVYDLLRQNILNGSYKPGTRLIIDDLAAKLKVSQIPIREALGQLEADGFITTEPYVGATVTLIDTKSIYEVFSLLESMEITSSCAACKTMTDHDLNQLERMVGEMDQSVGDPDEWSRQNQLIHLYICEIAQAMLTHRLMQKVFAHWDRLRLFFLKDVFANRIHEAQAGHKLLIEAFRKRDPGEIERILREHNQGALRSYIHHIEESS